MKVPPGIEVLDVVEIALGFCFHYSGEVLAGQGEMGIRG